MRRSGLVLMLMLAGSAGCDRTPPPSSAPVAPVEERVALPASNPEYSFAAGLADSYPDVVAFMRQFLETCLAGDYGAYRRMVSRLAEPESRTRFERILNALKSVHIESIATVPVREVAGPVYLVIGRAEFVVSDQAVRHRRDLPRRLGILVFEEEGEWRLALAPAELQPVSDEELAPASAPTTSTAPSFPWDDSGDY